MRFIGAMINVIGNLLPNRTPTPGASQPNAGSAENGAIEPTADPAKGSFTATLLQILKATGGSAAEVESGARAGGGESAAPGQETTGAPFQAAQLTGQVPGMKPSLPQPPVAEVLNQEANTGTPMMEGIEPSPQGPPEGSVDIRKAQGELQAPRGISQPSPGQEFAETPWINGTSEGRQVPQGPVRPTPETPLGKSPDPQSPLHNSQGPVGPTPETPLGNSPNPQGPLHNSQGTGETPNQTAETPSGAIFPKGMKTQQPLATKGMDSLGGKASESSAKPFSEERIREEGPRPVRTPLLHTTDQVGKSSLPVEPTPTAEVASTRAPDGNPTVAPISADEVVNPGTEAPAYGEGVSATSESASTPLESVSRSNGADDFPMDRDPEKLSPDFRHRLDRVVSRMEREFGHTVTMVEGYRTPDRQTAIYAQGRTAPGPVATWTQESLHSQGRAADLMVDGTWKNPAGYARLQQVAKEEGLGVLGSKDPGHVELPAEGVTPRGPRVNQSWMPTAQVGSGLARPAAVARPASVGVATAARVARPARAGQSWNAQTSVPSSPAIASTAQQSREVNQPLPQAPQVPKLDLHAGVVDSTPSRPIPGPDIVSTGPTETAAGPWNLSRIPGLEEKRPTETASVAASQNSSGAEADPVLPGLSESRPFQAQAPSTTDSVQRVNTAQRVNEILSLSETWDTQAPGRIHLDMEDVDGAGTRIRLAMRGSELAGSLDLSDPALATRMRERIGELHEALSRQGLDAQNLEARALTGVEGRAGAEGDMATLMKDPLTGLARLLEVRDSGVQNRGDDPRNPRQESQRGDERFKGERSRQSPERNPNKENKR